MNPNNRIHAIDAIAANVPAAPVASLPPDTSLETYGEDVFGEKEIRAYLPKATAAKLLATVNDGKPLDPSIADDVAHAMKDWALSKGATHFTSRAVYAERSPLRRSVCRPDGQCSDRVGTDTRRCWRHHRGG